MMSCRTLGQNYNMRQQREHGYWKTDIGKHNSFSFEISLCEAGVTHTARDPVLTAQASWVAFGIRLTGR